MATAQTSDWGKVDQLGRHHISTLPPYWLSRIYVALGTLFGLVVMWRETETLTHRLITNSGPQGWVVVSVLAGVSMLAIADVIVNDLLPDRWAMPFAKRKRHLVYMALSIGIFCMTYVFISEGQRLRWLVAPFWLDGLVAALIAYLDLMNRHRNPQ